MKNERIPTRRQPIRKTFYARLFNKAKPKKQCASAAAPTADDMEEGGINISRSLTIIFAIHIVAIGMIFIHKQYLSGRTAAPESAAAAAAAPVAKTTPAAAPSAQRTENLPVLSGGDKPYMVRKGDNYTIIAAKHNVDESELREMNRGTDIRAGVVLRIPQRQRIVAEMPPELTAIRDQARPSDSDLGLVEILPPADADTAKLIRPAVSENDGDIPRAAPVGSSRTHTVKSGENIWRISNQYKVSQKELMAVNNISDPTKLKIGQMLKLP
jgi:LysM repeat protein